MAVRRATASAWAPRSFARVISAVRRARLMLGEFLLLPFPPGLTPISTCPAP